MPYWAFSGQRKVARDASGSPYGRAGERSETERASPSPESRRTAISRFFGRAKICPNSFVHAGNRAIRAGFIDFSPQMWYIQDNQMFPVFTISFHHSKEVFVCCHIVSLRCVFWVGLSIRGGGNDSPRPASQRAAALVLTAAMLTTLTAPAFAKEWYIEEGDITVRAGETEGTNKVSQGENPEVEDTNTVITNSDKDKASSNTVTIEAKDKDDKVEVTLKDVNIDTSSRSEAAVSVTGEGNTNIELDGDNALKSDIYSSGISSNGSLTITGGENDSLTAQGGSGADGIYSSGSLTISGGMVTANGGGGDGGDGIWSSGGLTISGGTVNATGGKSGADGSGGAGIHSGSFTIYGGTVNAKGGNGGNVSGDGIISDGGVTISGGTVKAAGGDSKDGYGGDAIRSGGGVTISGNTVNAAGGNGGNVGGYGICSFDRVAISGGTVTANGGDSKDGYGGDGIYSNDIDLSGSLELTAKAGSPNGKALSQNGKELNLDTIKDKLGPGAKVTTTDADGKVNQFSVPRPVEPEEPVIPGESSSSSDGGSAAPSAPASPLPGLTVTDKDGQRISYTSTQSGNTLTVCVGRFTASLRASLATLRQLRAEGIDTITFQTILCSTTLSVDELLAMGGEDAEAVLTHRFTDSSLTVG